MLPAAASVMVVMLFMIIPALFIPMILTMFLTAVITPVTVAVFVLVPTFLMPVVIVIIIIMVISTIRIITVSFRGVPISFILQMARLVVVTVLRRTVLMIMRHIHIIVPLLADKINGTVTRAVLNAVTPPVLDVPVRRVQINRLMNNIGRRIDNRRIRINQLGQRISITQMNLAIKTRLPNLDGKPDIGCQSGRCRKHKRCQYRSFQHTALNPIPWQMLLGMIHTITPVDFVAACDKNPAAWR